MISYNTLIVLLGTGILGFISGVLGSFMLLRRKALLGDVISHSTLPGIAITVIALSLFISKSYSVYHFELILIGGTLSSGIGLIFFNLIRYRTHLKDDVSLALTLSVFFGFGVSLLSIIQQTGGSFSTGVESYIYGKASSILRSDVEMSFILSCLVLLMLGLFFRQFVLISFDSEFAKIKGFNTYAYDLLLFLLILLVCMLGLQAVGAILMLALFIVPAALMRFWTQNLYKVIWGAGIAGLISASIGSFLSTNFEGLPSGPAIVLTAVFFFWLSFLFGRSRGILWDWLSNKAYLKRTQKEHLLRYWLEYLESSGRYINKKLKNTAMTSVELSEIINFEADMKPERAKKVLNKLISEDLVIKNSDNSYSLTLKGLTLAEKYMRQHRLWEIFLVEHADLAPSVVDRSADELEHLLEPHMIRELEEILYERESGKYIPRSPHPLK